MRKLAVILLAATAPALADQSGPTADPLPMKYVFAAPAPKCYFIRQTNRQLQVPAEKPAFVPLAVAPLSTATPFANCMPDQRVIKTVIK
jgi:hypothetical protein